jgi:hypothetical protein
MRIKKLVLLFSTSVVVQFASAHTIQCLDYTTAVKLSNSVEPGHVFYQTDHQRWSLGEKYLPESGSWQTAFASVGIKNGKIEGRLYCFSESNFSAPFIDGILFSSSPSFKKCFLNGVPMLPGYGQGVSPDSILECE